MSAIDAIGANTDQIRATLQRIDAQKVSEIQKVDGKKGQPNAAEAVQTSLHVAGVGEVEPTDFTNAFQQLSTVMQSALVSLQENGGAALAPPPPPPPPSPEDLFAQVDEDADGVVTKDEFLNNQPEDVSAEEAEARWTALAGEDGESLTKEQFLTNLAELPPPPPPGGVGNPSSALVAEFINALQAYETAATDFSEEVTTTTSVEA
ncbi:hypothetical protein V5T82_02840 [Magnetovibrio sp. PR-2]|uniref:hypothetical protein n=1 Tax=Magnetovibrio sp. PR-2 TaxID=3120356 RepID=UPI002FCE48C0